MKKVYYSIRSLIKNLKKGKFYSVFRVIWDQNYRNQIKYMQSLLTEEDMVLGHGKVPLHMMTPGHSINYPSWVDTLVQQINTRGWKSIEPIKVVWDYNQGLWLVVDGNHRFAALKKTISEFTNVPVLMVTMKSNTECIDEHDLIEQIKYRNRWQ